MYKALALQLTCQTVNACSTREEAEAQMLASLGRIERQLEVAIDAIGRDTLLVTVPEHFLSGAPVSETLDEWREKAALEIDGAIYEGLSALAQRQKIYFAGNAYEQDPHFPELYFQTSFLLGPNGNVLLRYRRLNALNAPTPHDVWAYYLEAYGYDAIFPVVKTNIGNLACVASEDIMYPEVVRCLAMRGAEVVLHSASETTGAPFGPGRVAKPARAAENGLFVVSANAAGQVGSGLLNDTVNGGSVVIDHRGITVAEAGPGETLAAHADIDLEALRQHRQRPAATNRLARQRFELYAESYASHSFYPPNTLLADAPDRTHFSRTQQEVIEKLKRDIY